MQQSSSTALENGIMVTRVRTIRTTVFADGRSETTTTEEVLPAAAGSGAGGGGGGFISSSSSGSVGGGGNFVQMQSQQMQGGAGSAGSFSFSGPGYAVAGVAGPNGVVQMSGAFPGAGRPLGGGGGGR